ncbi:MAG: TolB family protein, partial [Actinocrinis sp.]
VENADGGNLHTLNPLGATDGTRVTWSPNGNWIQFRGGSGEGLVMHPDGSGPAIPSDATEGVAFSPDSANIVYGASNGLAQQLAYTPTQCASFNPKTGQSNDCSKPYFTVDTGGNDHDVTISASDVVYFQHDTMLNLATVQSSDIWTDHGNRTPDLLITNGTEPAISPDGQQLAFVRPVGGWDQIFVQAADGSGTAIQLTSGAATHDSPSWRPDGSGLFYTYNPDTQSISNAISHQLTLSGGTTTDTVVPGNLLDVTQQPLPARQTYHAYGPKRVLDTRTATGVTTKTPVPVNGTITIPIDGAQGLPASGISAVVLNVTVTGPKSAGYVTVYPDGQPAPKTSNLNFNPGQTLANMVTVPVVDGKVRFHNGSGGTVHLVADAFGYYTKSTADNAFTAVAPIRIMDTRTATGVRKGQIGPNGVVKLQITGANGVPKNATAAVLNLTATQGSSGGYLTVYPDAMPRPVTSNLNFAAGETRPNLAVVPLGADGAVDVYNLAGSVSALADLMGYFTPGA